MTYLHHCRHYLQSSLELTAAMAQGFSVTISTQPDAVLAKLASPTSDSWRVGQKGQASYRALLRAGWPATCAAGMVLVAILEYAEAGGKGLGSWDTAAVLAAAAAATEGDWFRPSCNSVGRLATMAGWDSQQTSAQQVLQGMLDLLPDAPQGFRITGLARAAATWMCRNQPQSWSDFCIVDAAKKDFISKYAPCLLFLAVVLHWQMCVVSFNST
jgi:hypothetical protein